MATNSQDHFLRMKEVRQRTGLATSSIYRKIQEGPFQGIVSGQSLVAG